MQYILHFIIITLLYLVLSSDFVYATFSRDKAAFVVLILNILISFLLFGLYLLIASLLHNRCIQTLIKHAFGYLIISYLVILLARFI